MSFKGKKNVYLCEKCGMGFVTEDVDEGVTPFMTECAQPGCKDMAKSLCYNIPQAILAGVTPVYEWYKPSSTLGLTTTVAHHVEMGGLLKRDAREL